MAMQPHDGSHGQGFDPVIWLRGKKWSIPITSVCYVGVAKCVKVFRSKCTGSPQPVTEIEHGIMVVRCGRSPLNCARFDNLSGGGCKVHATVVTQTCLQWLFFCWKRELNDGKWQKMSKTAVTSPQEAANGRKCELVAKYPKCDKLTTWGCDRWNFRTGS